MYVCTCIYTHTYIHTYIYIYIDIYKYNMYMDYRIDTSLHTTYIYLSISPSIYLAASSPASYLPSICVCVCVYINIYIYIYVYVYLCSPLPPPPHDRPSWERGRVVSVPRHDLSTDWNSKVSNFSQNVPPPFFPDIPEFQFSPQS